MVKTKIKYLNIAIFVIIPIIVGHLPPFLDVTPHGMQVLGILLGLLYGWITIDLLWTSLLGIVYLGITEFWTIGEVVAAGLGNNTVILCIFSFVLGAIAVSCGVAEVLANWFLTRKIFRKNPWFLAFGILGIAAVVSTLTMAGIAVIVIFGKVIADIGKASGYDERSKEIIFLQLALIPISSNLANSLPFLVGLIWMGWYRGVGGTIADSQYFWSVVIVWAISTLLVFLLAKFVFKLDFSRLKLSDAYYEELKSKSEFTRDQKIGMVVLAAVFVAMFGPVFLGTKFAIFRFTSKLTLVGVVIIIGVILTNIERTDGKGKNLFDFTNGFKSINWAIVWLLGISFPLGEALNSPEAGVTSSIVEFVQPLLTGLNPIAFSIIAMIIMGILTQFIHNVVLAIVFIGLLTNICVGIGGDPTLLFLMIYFALNHSCFATPAASMFSAIMFANGYTEIKDGYKFGISYFIVVMVSTLLFVPIYLIIW